MKLEESNFIFTQVEGPEDLKRIEAFLRQTFFPLSEFFITQSRAEPDQNDGQFRAYITFHRRYFSGH